MRIREECLADHEAIRALHLASFPTGAEANLVDALRADGDAQISLIGEEDETLVGHVMLSKMQAPFKALALAPISIHIEWRKRGVAQKLIESVIEQAKKAGWDGIFVLGDPAYYERFGFTTELAARFQSPYAGPYLMALSLQKNTSQKDALQNAPLHSQSGNIEYAPAFDALS